jgi:tetratricopeptide (TPR) repeat protein
VRNFGDGHDDAAALDRLVGEITARAHGDDETLRAFRRALEENVALPADAFVIGEPVSLIRFGYDGNTRGGLTALCRRSDGGEHDISAGDVVLASRAAGARYLAAYRRWLGIAGDLRKDSAAPRPRRQHKAAPSDLHPDGSIELVALSVKERAARCRLLGSDRVVTLRASRLWDVVPGEIVEVQPRKQWSYAGHPYMSGEIISTRLDVASLRLVPLRLECQGPWDPAEEYWGEEGEPIEEWAKPIIARGPREAFEMEQILPGADPNDPDSDPITESNDLKDAGDPGAALKILMSLCEADLLCLDAHAHLGNFAFNSMPADAIRHYEVGLRIGELSLGRDFDGVLSWGFVDNRPFLRCMHGYGLCCWRLDRFEEAERTFDRMLWLNPSDNQGARFLIGQVRARVRWQDGR